MRPKLLCAVAGAMACALGAPAPASAAVIEQFLAPDSTPIGHIRLPTVSGIQFNGSGIDFSFSGVRGDFDESELGFVSWTIGPNALLSSLALVAISVESFDTVILNLTVTNGVGGWAEEMLSDHQIISVAGLTTVGVALSEPPPLALLALGVASLGAIRMRRPRLPG